MGNVKAGGTMVNRVFSAWIVAVLVVLGACAPSMTGNRVDPSETELSATLETPSHFPDGETELSATLEMASHLPDNEAVVLKFTLTNSSDVHLYVLKWYTPFEGIGGEIFRVERDGHVVPYGGILAMRGDPTPEAYIKLAAGQSASAEVDLAAAFDFSQPGEYTIEFLSPRISHVARSEAEMARSVDDLGPVAIPSNAVTVNIGESSGEISSHLQARTVCSTEGKTLIIEAHRHSTSVIPHPFGSICQTMVPVAWINGYTATTQAARYGWAEAA
jgi:hypothetical protein